MHPPNLASRFFVATTAILFAALLPIFAPSLTNPITRPVLAWLSGPERPPGQPYTTTDLHNPVKTVQEQTDPGGSAPDRLRLWGVIQYDPVLKKDVRIQPNYQPVAKLNPNTAIADMAGSVGRINLQLAGTTSKFFCTGTLISENLILTAAHCFFKDGEHFAVWADVNAITFDLGPREHDAIVLDVNPKPEEIVCPRTRATKGHCTHGPSSDYDYAILKILPETPAMKAKGWTMAAAHARGYQPVRLASIDIVENHAFALVHYPEGQTQMVTEQNCLGTYVPPRAIDILAGHECDTKRGSSGGALFSRDHEVMIGMHIRGNKLFNESQRQNGQEANHAILISQIAKVSKIIGTKVPVEDQPPTAHQKFLIDYANQRGEESTALLADNRSTLAAYVALSGLERTSNRPNDREYLTKRIGPAQTHLANALYGNRELATVDHQNRVGNAVLSPDGTTLLTWEYSHTSAASWDTGLWYRSAARLWDTTTGKLITELDWPGVKVVGAEFSRDSTRLVTWAYSEGNPRLWNAKTGMPLYNSKMVGGSVLGAHFSPDGNQLVTWSNGGPARILNVATGDVSRELRQHEGQVWEGQVAGAEFNPDGDRLVTWGQSEDSTCLWNAATGEPLHELKEHLGSVGGAVFSPQGDRLVTWSSKTSALQLREARTGILLYNLSPKHRSIVLGASFSPDGFSFVTWAYKDTAARVWDAKTGRHLRDLSQNENPVAKASYSGDNAHILTWGENFVRLWDAKTKEPAVEIDGEEKRVRGALFSRNGTQFATWGVNQLRVWNAMACTPTTGCRLTAELKEHENGIRDASFDHDGGRVVTYGGNYARLWNVKTTTLAIELKGHEAAVTHAEFTRDSSRLLTLPINGRSARLWNAKTGTLIAEPRGRKGTIEVAAFSPDKDNKLLLTWSSGDTSVLLWNATKGGENPIGELKVHSGVAVARFSPDSSSVVTWGQNEPLVRLWNLKTRRPVELTWRTEPVSRNRTGNPAQGVPFSADSRLFVTWSQGDRVARIWNAQTGAPVGKIGGHSTGVAGAQFSRDGAKLVTLAYPEGIPTQGNSKPSDRMVQLWNAKSGVLKPLRWPGVPSEIRISYSLLDGGVEGISFNHDSTRLLTYVHGDKGAQLWDAESGNPIKIIEARKGMISGAMFSPDGTQIVTWTSREKSAFLWNGRTGEFESELKDHGDLVMGASFSPDSEYLVTSSYDVAAVGNNSPQLWNAKKGTRIARLEGHEGAIIGASFSPDSTALVTWGGGNFARLWNAKTGTLSTELKGPVGGVYFFAAFSPDNAQLVTFGSDTPRLWSVLGDGKCLIESAYQRLEHVRPSISECDRFGLDCKRDRTPSGACSGMGAAHVNQQRLRLLSPHP